MSGHRGRPRPTVVAERLRDHLERLYGPEDAATWTPRLLERMAATAGRLGDTPRRATPFGPETSILITYGDQVRSPGEPPLRTLRRLLEGPLAGTTSAVHLLPIFPATSDDGFAVADYLAVDPALGSWDDVAAIGRGRELMLDVVMNHTSASHTWFRAFLAGDGAHEGWYVTADPSADLSATVRPRTTPLLTPFEAVDGVRHVWTTFSADQVDLDYRRPEVLAAMLDVLLGYVERGARFVRLDAITYLWKEPGTPSVHLEGTHELIKLVRTVLDASAPDVVIVSETNVPHAENVSYFGNGDDEAHMVYNFALPPLMLHTVATGDARALRDWARELTTPSDRAAFLNFLASHDGIGVRAVEGILPSTAIAALTDRVRQRGGRVSTKRDADGAESPYELNVALLDALADPGRPEADAIRRLVAAHALMLALPGVPAVYVHSLLGSRNDGAALAATGRARSINRGRFDLASLERDLADRDGRRRRVLDALRRLLRTRSLHPAFAPAEPARWPEAPPSVAAVVRGRPPSEVLAVHNLGASPLRLDGAALLGRAWPSGAYDLLGGAPAPDGDVALTPFEVRWIALEG